MIIIYIYYITYINFVYYIQITQEGFHFILRMQKKGVFRYLSADGKYARQNALHVINSLSQKYDLFDTPPLMSNHLRTDPYGLVAHHKAFIWIHNEKERTMMKNAVRCVWKLSDTRCRKKIQQLRSVIHKIDSSTFKKRIINMFNIPNDRWVDKMFGV